MRLMLGRWLGLGLTLLTLHAAACAPPGRGAAGRGEALVVGLVGPASVAWLDDGDGGHGAPLAGAPVQVARGPGGSVVALTAGAAGGGSLELEVVRPWGSAGAQAAPLRVGALETSGAAWLAADGQRYALAAYWRRPGAPPSAGAASPVAPADGAQCALLVADLLRGEASTAPGPCRAHERVRSVALDPGGLDGGGPPAGFAYLGLEDTRSGSEHGPGRLVLLALPSRMVAGSLALPGTPVDLRLAPRGRGAPPALYLLERSGGAGGVVPAPDRGHVLVLDPLTLDVLGEHPLDGPASRLLPAPDGRSAFLIQHDVVQRLDLGTGTLRQLARLPGRVVAAELAGGRLYLGSPEGRVLWVLDARTGLRRPDLRLPGHPVSLAPAGPRAG